MRVSVAMATHNGERYLAEQLESLSAQTLPPLELVVQDDCSTDGTLTQLERFTGRSSFPVRVESNDARKGFAETFLAAASRCTGEAIAFCDQDDVWNPEKLAECAGALDAGVLLVMHSCVVADERLQPTGRLYPHYRAARVQPRLTGDPWLSVRGMAMVFDARLLDASWERRPRSHYLPEASMHHDEWIYLLAHALGTVEFLPRPLALYRQHQRNVTGTGAGLTTRVQQAVRLGWSYYGARRDQALDAAKILRELASKADDVELAERYSDAAEFHSALAQRIERRRAVYDPSLSTRGRYAKLARLVRSGLYAGADGFGAGALARDLLMISLGRHG